MCGGEGDVPLEVVGIAERMGSSYHSTILTAHAIPCIVAIVRGICTRTVRILLLARVAIGPRG